MFQSWMLIDQYNIPAMILCVPVHHITVQIPLQSVLYNNIRDYILHYNGRMIDEWLNKK